MFLLDTLDAKLAEARSAEEIIALYNAVFPAAYQVNLPRGPGELARRARQAIEPANSCAGAVQFVIAYVMAAQGSGAFRDIDGINGRQSAMTSEDLSAATAPGLLNNLMAAGGDYIGLLTDNGARIGHTAVFVSYGLSCLSRTWGFYQANADNVPGFPPFTLSKTVNRARGVRDMNMTNMDTAEFRRFFIGLTAPGSLAVLPGAGRARCAQWFLNVVRFNGTAVIL